MSSLTVTDESRGIDRLHHVLAAQQAESAERRVITAQERRQRIQGVINLLVEHRTALAAAMDEDFGGRHPGFSLMNDVLGSLGSLKHARDSLEDWMQPSVRQPSPPYDALGATARVTYQPKGSVGIIGTWNAPLFTLFSPLAYALAAGNRAVVKPSEVVPRTGAVLAAAAEAMLDPREVAVVTGGSEVAEALTAAPFDHLVFTGSTAVARAVLRNAAENLVPVTLELGGKSPVVVGRSADLPTAAFRIAVGKATNSGQICVTPDTVFVARDQLDDFLSALAAAYRDLLPTVAGNPDAVAVINQRHLERVEAYLREAAELGARIEVVPAEPAAHPVATDRRRPLSIVVDPPAGARIRDEEIFGPALVVLPYEGVDEAIEQINSGPHPLALYYFGKDAAEQEQVVSRTTSGGVTVNDVMMHPAMQNAPFGGIGPSGMGHYHGREGFLEFSHARTVVEAPEADPRREWGMVPPYPESFAATMDGAVATS